jgi:tRNA (guanine10-N2)-methyltransferase
MIDDLLHFAAEMVVDDGRLAMWMPTANDEDVELAIPQNPYFELVSSCVQIFNKCASGKSPFHIGSLFCIGSRRLLTYRRLPEAQTGPVLVRELRTLQGGAKTNDLNSFRKRASHKFETPYMTRNLRRTVF